MFEEWDESLTVQRNTNLPAIFGLKFFSIDLHCSCMSNQEAVANRPGLAAAISYRTLRTVTGAPRGKQTRVITEN